MTINLDQTTPINYLNLREGNAFGFQFTIQVNETPIAAADYDINLSIFLGGKLALKIADADWTKDAATITKLYSSFPLPAGNYTFHCTYTNPAGQVVTIVPGTLKIIKKDA